MSEKVSWRQANPADAPRILELTRQAYAKWIAVIGREPKPVTADYAKALLLHRFDLLESGTSEGGVSLVGLIETIAKADHLLIENVAVAPGFQKRGYGRMLLAHAEDVAAGMAFSDIRLFTNIRFTENIALYTRLGYSVDREEAFPGGIMVHMRKRLR